MDAAIWYKGFLLLLLVLGVLHYGRVLFSVIRLPSTTSRKLTDLISICKIRLDSYILDDISFSAICSERGVGDVLHRPDRERVGAALSHQDSLHLRII